MPTQKPIPTTTTSNPSNTKLNFIARYFTMIMLLGLLIGLGIGFWLSQNLPQSPQLASTVQSRPQYWFVLYRSSNIEQLFQGVPGDYHQSRLVKTFKVKTGIPAQRPTPLPKLVDREYWLVTKKYPSTENPETAPYFLELDVPGIDQYPYGPTPYLECAGQCNWQLPGAFGLHGINGDSTRLSADNPGSSGCIRHTDHDITYLYHLLELDQPIRYYVEEL